MKLNKTIKTLGFTILTLMPISSIFLGSENNQIVSKQVDYKITEGKQDVDQTIVFRDPIHYLGIKPVFEEAHFVETYEYADNEYNIYLSLSTEFYKKESNNDFIIQKSTNYDLGIFISTSTKANWDSVDFEAYIEGPEKSNEEPLEGNFLDDQNADNKRWMMFEKSFRVLPEEVFDPNGILEDITKQDIVIDLIDNESNTNIIENQEISELTGFENWKNTVKSGWKQLNNQHHYLKENNKLDVFLKEEFSGEINIDIEADIEIINGSRKAPPNLPERLSVLHEFYGLGVDIYYDVESHNDITVGEESITIEKINLEFAFKYEDSNENFIVNSDINIFNWGLKGSLSNYTDISNDIIFTSSEGDEYTIDDLETTSDLFDFELINMKYIYLNKSQFVNDSKNDSFSSYYANYEFLPVDKNKEIIAYVWVGISGVGLITGVVLIILTYKKQKINIKK